MAMTIVDMQNDFFNYEGSMNKGGMDITELKNSIAGEQSDNCAPQR